MCIFNKKLLQSFKAFTPIWSFLKGVVIWCIWIKMNEGIFNNKAFSNHKLGVDDQKWLNCLQHVNMG